MAAVLLDVTRLVSRLGRGALTGIDRVELAYLRHLLSGSDRAFGLLRTRAGILLIGRDGLILLKGWAEGLALPDQIDIISRLTRRHDPRIAAVETALRKTAIARAPLWLAGQMLLRNLPRGMVYLNVGHTNLTARLLQAMKQVPASCVAILIHDTIPLEHPSFGRPDRTAAFTARVRAAARYSDLVIHTAQTTRHVNEVHFRHLADRVPPGVVAPLGIDRAEPDPAALPPGLDIDTPFFLTVGTIEPRKNHSLLLDVWTSLPRHERPNLLIVGNRGWADATTLERLDRGIEGVHVLHNVTDAALACLMDRARAMLLPTMAEGFGLPALEAAKVGLPLILSDLPIFRELLKDYPVYLPTKDIYSWTETVRALANETDRRRHDPLKTPTWTEHFQLVFRACDNCR